MLANFIVRGLQIIFGVIVLGLSIGAVKWQVIGTAPATTGYNAFAGAFGILTALIGIAAAFMEMIPELIMAIVDGLASVIFLAGGIAFAVGLKGVSCGDDATTYDNYLLTGGCKGKGQNEECGFDSLSQLEGRCKMIEADSAFLFLGFLASVAAAVMCFMASRGRGSTKHSAV